LGWLEAKIDADEGKVGIKMDCLEKMETTVKAGQEQMSQN
jgi:hypothetical protein